MTRTKISVSVNMWRTLIGKIFGIQFQQQITSSKIRAVTLERYQTLERPQKSY